VARQRPPAISRSSPALDWIKRWPPRPDPGYAWKHDEQDGFFFVLDGLFRIELEGADTVELGPRQAFTVPAGMLHRPVVPVRSAVLMIEKAGVIATGD
jgi:mannose-6-phosphate isomerase-like protein (cupin superfamily)